MQRDNLEKIIGLRHELHRYPELSMNEKKTSQIIKSFLRAHTDLRIVDRGSWFYAVKTGREETERIAFRADMDALPISEDSKLPYHSLHEGVSHKCGHDGHSAALCGLALELDRLPVEPTVFLIFQPGEEDGQGGAICKNLIREEQISEIYAFHNLSGYPENSLVYREGLTQPSSEGLRITFQGRTSHASAPEEGLNPSEVISKAVLYVSRISQRQSKGMLLCTVTGIRLGSGDFGISPGDGELCLTLRAEYEQEMKELEADILTFIKVLCEDSGVLFEVSMQDYFPETRNDEKCLSRVIHAAEKTGLPVIRMNELWRASEDFGWYLKECPGAMVYIGNGENYPALHTISYDYNDCILETAVDVFLETVKHRHSREEI